MNSKADATEITNVCIGCGTSDKVGADRLCGGCRVKRFGQARRKYHFTPALLEELRETYCGSKPEITAGLDRLVEKTGWPRHAFTYEAVRRWGSTEHRKPWTAEEIEHLREGTGSLSISRLAKEMRRSKDSVSSKLARLGLSARVMEGYSVADLSQVFGVRDGKVRRWLERRLFGTGLHWYGNPGARVPERNVLRFIRQHASEYDMRRVDQAWLKAMLFGELTGHGL